MHSPGNKPVHASEAVNGLIEACPEIFAYIDSSEGENYIFSQVAILVADGTIAEPLLGCVFSHFNRMAEKSIDIQNVLIFNALEVLSDTPEGIRLARERLREPAKEMFERVLRGWIEESGPA